MTKSQFNIKISKELLIKVKRQAMMSGKSLTEHITDLVTKSLSDNDLQNIDLSSVNKIEDLEKNMDGTHLEFLKKINDTLKQIQKDSKPFFNRIFRKN